MTRLGAAWLVGAVALAQAQAPQPSPQPSSQPSSQPTPQPTSQKGGPAIRRVANMPDGAPAFVLIDARGAAAGRIECIFNGWYDSDAMAARLLAAPAVMAALIAKGGHLAIEDLGPATFNCVVVRRPAAP